MAGTLKYSSADSSYHLFYSGYLSPTGVNSVGYISHMTLFSNCDSSNPLTGYSTLSTLSVYSGAIFSAFFGYSSTAYTFTDTTLTLTPLVIAEQFYYCKLPGIICSILAPTVTTNPVICGIDITCSIGIGSYTFTPCVENCEITFSLTINGTA